MNELVCLCKKPSWLAPLVAQTNLQGTLTAYSAHWFHGKQLDFAIHHIHEPLLEGKSQCLDHPSVATTPIMALTSGYTAKMFVLDL